MSLKQILKLWPLFPRYCTQYTMFAFKDLFQVACITHDKMNFWLSAKNIQETNFDFRQSLGTTKFHVHSLGIVLKMW